MVSEQLKRYRRAIGKDPESGKSNNSNSNSSRDRVIEAKERFLKSFNPKSDIGKAQKSALEREVRDLKSGAADRRRSSVARTQAERAKTSQSFTVTKPGGRQVIRTQFSVGGVRTVQDIDPRTRQVIRTQTIRRNRNGGSTRSIKENLAIRKATGQAKLVLTRAKTQKQALANARSKTLKDFTEATRGLTAGDVLRNYAIVTEKTSDGGAVAYLKKRKTPLLPKGINKTFLEAVNKIEGGLRPVVIGGKFLVPRNEREAKLYRDAKKVYERDEKFKRDLDFALKKSGAGTNVPKSAVLPRALQGAVETGVGVLFLGNTVANLVDKGLQSAKELTFGGDVGGKAQKKLGDQLGKAAKDVLGKVNVADLSPVVSAVKGVSAIRGRLSDPRNWAGDLLLLTALAEGVAGFSKVRSPKINVAKNLGKSGTKKAVVTGLENRISNLRRLNRQLSLSGRVGAKVGRNVNRLVRNAKNVLNKVRPLSSGVVKIVSDSKGFLRVSISKGARAVKSAGVKAGRVVVNTKAVRGAISKVNSAVKKLAKVKALPVNVKNAIGRSVRGRLKRLGLLGERFKVTVAGDGSVLIKKFGLKRSRKFFSKSELRNIAKIKKSKSKTRKRVVPKATTTAMGVFEGDSLFFFKGVKSSLKSRLKKALLTRFKPVVNLFKKSKVKPKAKITVSVTKSGKVKINVPKSLKQQISNRIKSQKLASKNAAKLRKLTAKQERIIKGLEKKIEFKKAKQRVKARKAEIKKRLNLSKAQRKELSAFKRSNALTKGKSYIKRNRLSSKRLRKDIRRYMRAKADTKAALAREKLKFLKRQEAKLLEAERRGLRKQVALSRKGRQPKAVRSGRATINGKDVYVFTDLRTGKTRYFNSRKKWLKAVKQQSKSVRFGRKTSLPEYNFRTLFSSKNLQRQVSTPLKREVVSLFLDAKTGRISKGVNRVAKATNGKVVTAKRRGKVITFDKVVNKPKNTAEGVSVKTSNGQTLLLRTETAKKTKIKPKAKQRVVLVKKPVKREILRYYSALVAVSKKKGDLNKNIRKNKSLSRLHKLYFPIFASGVVPQSLKSSVKPSTRASTSVRVRPVVKVKSKQAQAQGQAQVRGVAQALRPRTLIKQKVGRTVKFAQSQRFRQLLRQSRSRLTKKRARALRNKAKSKKDKEELKEWVRSVSSRYRPSLAAVIYNITGYKVPKSITGFEIRPIIVKRKKRRVVKRSKVSKRRRKRK